MLLSKNILHLIKIKKQLKVFLPLDLVFHNLKKKECFLVMVLSLFKSVIQRRGTLCFSFEFKVSVMNFIYFSGIYLRLLNFLKKMDLFTFFKFNIVKSQKKIYTIIRSPFVYKKSKSQLSRLTLKGFFKVSFKTTNVILLDYLESSWFKNLEFPFYFKILVRKKVSLQ